jgi:hypothetical protein
VGFFKGLAQLVAPGGALLAFVGQGVDGRQGFVQAGARFVGGLGVFAELAGDFTGFLLQGFIALVDLLQAGATGIELCPRIAEIAVRTVGLNLHFLTLRFGGLKFAAAGFECAFEVGDQLLLCFKLFL